MANLSEIKKDSNWGEAASTINSNFQNMNVDLEKVKSATTKFRGYFTSETVLKQKYPSPQVGDTAYVGEPYPGTVYDVQVAGTWHNTGTAPDTEVVDLTEYARKEELTELENDNIDTFNLTALSSDETQQGYYLNGSFVSNPGFVTKTYAVDSNLSYVVNTLVIGSGFKAVNYFSSADVFVSGEADASDRKIMKLIKPPSGASYCRVTSSNGYVGFLSLKSAEKSDYNLNELGNYVSDNLGDRRIHKLENKYVDTGGAKIGSVFTYKQQTSESIEGTVIDIEEGRSYYLTSKGSSVYSLSYVVLDGSGVVLSMAEANDMLVDHKIPIPEDGKKIIANNVLNDDFHGELYSVSDRFSVLEETVEANRVKVESLEESFFVQKTLQYSRRHEKKFIGTNLVETDYGSLCYNEYDVSQLNSVSVETYLKDVSGIAIWIALKDDSVLRYGEKPTVAGEVTRFTDDADVTDADTLYVNGLLNQNISVSTDAVVKPNEMVRDIEDNTARITSSEQEIEQVKRDIAGIESGTAMKGKNVLMLGDSIIEFVRNGKGIAEYIAEYTGANVIRGAIGGSDLARRLRMPEDITGVGEAYAALDVISVVEALVNGDFSLQEKAVEYLKENADDDNTVILNNLKSVDLDEIDIVTISAGTNDSRISGTVLGELTDTETYRNISGAMNSIISLLLSGHPNISVYFFTPIPRLYARTNDGSGKANGDWSKWSDVYDELESGLTLPDICEKIKEVAKYNHIPCCDMYWELGWNRYNFGNFLLPDSTDGTHPFLGFDRMASKMASFINSNATFLPDV